MSNRRRSSWIARLAVAFGAITACTTGTPYAQVAGTLPAPPAGQGRILLYMTSASAQLHFFPDMTIDGAPVGTIRPGTFFYVDRQAGLHQIGVGQKQASVISSQIATDPVTIDVIPGATSYVSASAVAIVAATQVILRSEAPDDAVRDLSDLSWVPPAK